MSLGHLTCPSLKNRAVVDFLPIFPAFRHEWSVGDPWRIIIVSHRSEPCNVYITALLSISVDNDQVSQESTRDNLMRNH